MGGRDTDYSEAQVDGGAVSQRELRALEVAAERSVSLCSTAKPSSPTPSSRELTRLCEGYEFIDRSVPQVVEIVGGDSPE